MNTVRRLTAGAVTTVVVVFGLGLTSDRPEPAAEQPRFNEDAVPAVLDLPAVEIEPTSTAASRDYIIWMRDYGRDWMQSIGRGDLVAVLQAPISNDDQLSSSLSDIQTEIVNLQATQTPDMAPYWPLAQVQMLTDRLTVSEGGLMPDDLVDERAQMISDPDPNVQLWHKAFWTLVTQAAQRDLYQQAQP